MTLPPHLRPARTSTLLLLSLLLVTRLGVGLLYSLSVPIWEADNEDSHFAYARYIAQHHALPQGNDPEVRRNTEKMQPPLYYIVVAALITPFAWEGPFQPPERNPYLASGVAGPNYAIHPPSLQDDALVTFQAVMLVRFFGVVLTTLAVLFVFASARLLWPRQPSLVWAATCLYAFWPQFLFTGSMVTNDVLLISLSTVCFYLSLTLITHGPQAWRLLLLALALGVALFTKLNALALLPAAGLALLFSLRQAGWSFWRIGLVCLGTGLLTILALGALLSQPALAQHLLRNANLDLLIDTVLPQGDPGPYLRVLSRTVQFQFRTFVASYGWGNLEAYGWLYPLWAMLFALFGLGWVVAAIRRVFLGRDAIRRTSPRDRRLWFLMWTYALSHIALTVALALGRGNPIVPGRYLLPGLPAIALLLFGGWQKLILRPWQPRVWKVLSVGFVLVGWSLPLASLMPAYAAPLPAPAARLEALQPINAVFDNQIELIGSEPAAPAAPGQSLRLTLCWQALQPVKKNYTFILEIVGPDGQGYGGLRTYPGHGNYATSFWRARVPFCELYKVQVGTGMPSPAVAKVLVELWDEGAQQTVPLTQLGEQPAGEQPKPVAVLFKVRPAVAATPAPEHATTYRFGNELILRGYDMQSVAGTPGSVRVTLHWEAVKAISARYVVFVHLRDTPRHIYSQKDSEPRGAWYPTSWWSAGETVLDEHTLALPQGNAPPLDLYVGIYDVAGGLHLPVVDAQGKPVPNDEVILAQGLSLP